MKVNYFKRHLFFSLFRLGDQTLNHSPTLKIKRLLAYITEVLISFGCVAGIKRGRGKGRISDIVKSERILL